jgi:DNA-binding response OmpR family regulator
VVTRDGAAVALSRLEMRLLRYFVSHRGEVLSRDRLLDEVCSRHAGGITTALSGR